MNGVRILVVDDEPQIQRFLKPALVASGFAVTAVLTGREALRAIANAPPDIVLLDLGLPDMDGKDVLREARGFSIVPIVVLSAREREAEKITALDLGADDYVEKPFAIGELLARLRTALRHAQGGRKEVWGIEIDGFKVDLVKRMVSRNGIALRLTPREYDVLAILVRHAGRVVTHHQILAGVWGPAHKDDTQYLRVFISQLRTKIEPDPSVPSLVLTEPGVGYRFKDPDC